MTARRHPEGDTRAMSEKTSKEDESLARPSDAHLRRAVGLLADFVAGWTEVYVSPPEGQDETEAREARKRLSLTHQRAEMLLAAMGVVIPEVPR